MAKIRITLIGCGFVGMSLGYALKNAIKDVEIVGHDKDRDAMKRAEQAKAIDRGDWNIPNACDNAAAVLISAPGDLEITFKALAQEAQPNTLVATVGGSATQALKMGNAMLPHDVPFFATTLIYHPDRVPAAVETPAADSVRDAIWTVAPRDSTSGDMVDVFAALAAEVGAKAIFVDPIERDGMSIAVDALPRVLSSVLMLTVSGDGAWRERQWMAGSSFGQSVAGVDGAPAYAPMLVAQPDATIHWLNQVMLQCMTLRDALRDRDEQAIQHLLEQAVERRDQWLADWRRGRDEGREPMPQQNAVLSLFLGERMADRVAGNRRR
jgi:prephenate dehydrogenase